MDEKSQAQAALARSQPTFPMMPGMPEKCARPCPPWHHEPVRSDERGGWHRNLLHAPAPSGDRAKKFLQEIDQEMPTEMDLHVVCDNYPTHTSKSPSVTAWIEKHPRFHMHVTPAYSS